jgi:dTDP-glucose pyrophosphorylase
MIIIKTLDQFFLSPKDTVLTAIENLDKGSIQIALVVDEAGALRGIVTDGDIRRGLIKGLTLESTVASIMNVEFISAGQEHSDEEIENIALSHSIRQVPVLSSDGIVDRLALTSSTAVTKRPNKIIIMAGGRGLRMRPLTEKLPKPMLRIGGQPILEIILRNLVQAGFLEIIISVNYKKDVIMDYFGNGSKFGCSIAYLEEDKPLGTAGALSLLSEEPDCPFLLMNGDLFTSLSFDKLLRHHVNSGSILTMGVRKYTAEVPFGVVNVADGSVVSIEEKPKQDFLVNAGIYAISPETLSSLKEGELIDMPDFISGLLEYGGHVDVFFVHEEWRDVGRPDDLANINASLGIG